jgi:hypothetical protein
MESALLQVVGIADQVDIVRDILTDELTRAEQATQPWNCVTVSLLIFIHMLLRLYSASGRAFFCVWYLCNSRI